MLNILENIFIKQTPSPTTASTNKESRAIYLTFAPISEEKYETKPLNHIQKELAKKKTEVPYTSQEVYPSPTSSTHTTKYQTTERTYHSSSQPSYDTTKQSSVDPSSVSYSSSLYEYNQGYETRNEHQTEQKYEAKPTAVKGSSRPLYGKIEPYEPETEYKFVITTSLNSKWKTTLDLDEIATTANNSGQPEGIIGFTMTSAGYKAAELSIFSLILALVAFSIVILVISGTL